jgi:hypothetical protein
MTNMFGGKNPLGLYVPMTEDEQEVIMRLVEAEDLLLVIHEWGVVNRPRLIVGDHRVGVRFRLDFDRPVAPMPVYYFDLELKTRTGISLHKERLPTIWGGQPIQVAAGVFFEMQWDIAIHSLDPKLVKLVKPSHTGLTSRRQDADTGDMTAQGNMVLTSKQREVLHELEAAQAEGRQENLRQAKKATERSIGRHKP